MNAPASVVGAVTYLTPDRRVHAAAHRATLVRALSIEHLDLLFTATTRQPLTSGFEPDRGPARATMLGRAWEECAEVHRVLHAGIDACHAARHCRNTETPAGLLAGLCFDVVTATDVSSVAELIGHHDGVDVPVGPDADEFEEHRARRSRTVNRAHTAGVLRWAAAAAACVGYTDTAELEAFWAFASAVAELGAEQARVGASLAPTWTGTTRELISTVTAVTAP